MEEIYRECAIARNKYIDDAESKLPSYCVRYEDGEKYLSPEVYDRIQREGRAVYEKKLNELTRSDLVMNFIFYPNFKFIFST
jgi:hypothetical protein